MLNLCMYVTCPQQLSSSFQALCLAFFSPYLPCSPRLRSNLPLLLPHMHAGCRQWPALERSPSSAAAGPTWSSRRRVWDGAPTSAPESLALLHARHRCLWRHGCLLSGLGSRAAAISLPDRTTSSRTRSSSKNCRRRWRPSSFGTIFHCVNPGIGCLPPVRCHSHCGAPPSPWAARVRRRQRR